VTWQLQADATLIVAWPGGALSAPLSVRRLRPPTDAEADAAVAWCAPGAAVELRGYGCRSLPSKRDSLPPYADPRCVPDAAVELRGRAGLVEGAPRQRPAKSFARLPQHIPVAIKIDGGMRMTSPPACSRRAGGLCAERDGALRAWSHRRFAPPPIHFIPDSRTDSVALFLKRRCDPTLGSMGRRRPQVPLRLCADPSPRGRRFVGSEAGGG
jgi:hypothetical protein